MMADSRPVRCTVCLLLALFADTAVGATRGIWISPEEVQSLPMSGVAWNSVRTTAYGSWGTPNLSDQTVEHAARALAGALVYVRTGDATLRAKARDAVIEAKRTLDSSTELGGARTLSVGRQLGGYVIVADLIDLESYDPAADAEFRPWLDSMRTTILPNSNSNHGLTITLTNESHAMNWSSRCGQSRTAASLYLGDAADVARCDSIFRAWSERPYYPRNAWPKGPTEHYFARTGDWSGTWACDSVNWTAISPPCVKNGQNYDGAIVDDISRSGAFTWPPGDTGMMYSWGSLEALFTWAEMLYRAGHNSYAYGNQALKRSMDFMMRAGWRLPSVDSNAQFVPWIANKRYGTSYPAPTPIPTAYMMGWTDWTHATGAPPPDLIPPAAITDLAP